ncbi:MAG: hypothetical protein DCF12_07495 [Snowella sp.]|jgi:hypothetical protein|nr:MAG: hypothetical protein DCF12_07495 [Snowella sp.]
METDLDILDIKEKSGAYSLGSEKITIFGFSLYLKGYLSQNWVIILDYIKIKTERESLIVRSSVLRTRLFFGIV